MAESDPMTEKQDIDTLVQRFLTWPLPQSVCADLCATDSSYKFSRSGTNLLSAVEAKQMIEYLLAAAPMTETDNRPDATTEARAQPWKKAVQLDVPLPGDRDSGTMLEETHAFLRLIRNAVEQHAARVADAKAELEQVWTKAESEGADATHWCREAARLTAERDDWQRKAENAAREAQRMAAYAQRLTTERDRLASAAIPFARFAETLAERHPGFCHAFVHFEHSRGVTYNGRGADYNGCGVTYNDFYRLRDAAALAHPEPEKEGR